MIALSLLEKARSFRGSAEAALSEDLDLSLLPGMFFRMGRHLALSAPVAGLELFLDLVLELEQMS